MYTRNNCDITMQENKLLVVRVLIKQLIFNISVFLKTYKLNELNLKNIVILSAEEWSYANDGYEGEPEQRPISLTRKPSLKPESPDTNERVSHQPGPSTASHMQRRRTISKSGSETSHRLSSKPSTPAPFIPKEDYPIPRAELSDRRPNARSESDVSDGFDSGKEYVQKVKLFFAVLPKHYKISLLKSQCYSFCP